LVQEARGRGHILKATQKSLGAMSDVSIFFLLELEPQDADPIFGEFNKTLQTAPCHHPKVYFNDALQLIMVTKS
jgi:hypothetical protein